MKFVHKPFDVHENWLYDLKHQCWTLTEAAMLTILVFIQEAGYYVSSWTSTAVLIQEAEYYVSSWISTVVLIQEDT